MLFKGSVCCKLCFLGVLLRRELRPHQTEGYAAAVGVLSRGSAATVVMACASGKTLLGLRVAERYSRILILEPSLALIRHSLEHAREEGLLINRHVFCVCSDESVAGRDEWLVSETELGIPVTTDASELQRLIAQSPNRCIVFCTYHSQRLLQAALPPGFKFDMGLFDEAHRTAGERERAFTVALSDSNIPIGKRLFLTATPRLFSEKEGDEPDSYRAASFSMDDESIYGPVAYELSLPEAIHRDIVCDIQVLVSSVSDAEVQSILQKAQQLMLPNKRLPVELVAGQISVVRAVQATGARRVISFHRTIAQAAAFAKDRLKIYEAAGIIPFHIRGDMPDHQRKAVIKAFLSVDGPSLLTNSRCLTEGVDVPDIDMVTFMGRKESLIDVVQATGRAGRKAVGKRRGYVMLPLYVHQEEPLEAALERSDMSVTWEILHTVLEADGQLVNRLRQPALTNGDDALPAAYHRKKGQLRVVASADLLASLERAITIRHVHRLGERWNVMIGVAERYAERVGNLHVPPNHLEEDLPLGRWIAKQRILNREGSLICRARRQTRTFGRLGSSAAHTAPAHVSQASNNGIRMLLRRAPFMSVTNISTFQTT